MPTVRLAFWKYVLATRLTSSAFTAAIRSRWMNSNRQSPRADEELRALAIAWLFAWSISTLRMLRVLALVTSSSVKGVSPSDSRAFTNASRVASMLSGGHEAEAENKPGSCELSDREKAVVASFDSTSAL